MFQHVNQIFIAQAANLTVAADAAAVGEIVMADQDYQPVAGGDTPEVVYLGLVEGKETVYDGTGAAVTKSVVRWSMPIQIDKIRSMVANDFEAKTEDVLTYDFSGVGANVIEVGHRYVLRIIYRDVYEAPGQYTQQWEVIASTANVADLIASFEKKINKQKGSRVIATSTGTSLTLTAKQIVDYDPYMRRTNGVIDNYSQVSMEGVFYTTIPTGLLSNVAYPVTGLEITKTQGGPGKGNAYIVRDREYQSLGYRGILYRTGSRGYNLKPALTVDVTRFPANGYDEFILEWDNKFRTSDMNYIKQTPLALEIYGIDGADVHTDIQTALEAIINA